MAGRTPRGTHPARRSRGFAAFAVLVVTMGTLTGCGAGKHPAVLDDAPLDTQSATIGDIDVRGAIVVSPEDPNASGTATLVVTFVNTGSAPDSFVGATFGSAPGIDPPSRAKAMLSPASIELPGDVPVVVPSEKHGTADLDGTFQVGTYVTAQLSFARAGSVTMTLLVVAPTGRFEPYATDTNP